MDYRIDLNCKSRDFRNCHGIGLNNPVSFKALLSKLNILTVFKPLDVEISGMVGKVGNSAFMMINSNHSIGRQNFTIAHELYHLYYDSNFKKTIIDTVDCNTGEEKKANAFASYLLLPDGLIELIPEKEKAKNKLSSSTLVKIEQYYQCSRSALLFRLKSLGLADAVFIESHKSNVMNQARLLGYDTELYQPGNQNKVYGDYTYKAKLLFDNEVISESHYLDLLHDIGISVGEMNTIEENESF